MFPVTSFARGTGLTPRFLGQFLLEQGEIDARELRDATDLMFWTNRAIGEIAQQRGYLSRADVRRILRAQASSDALFGDLAVELGLLTSERLAELLERQRARQLRLGDALVELGFVTRERIAELLPLFEEEQRAFRPEHRQLPPELASSRPACALLDQLPRIALRSGALGLKVGAWRLWSGEPELDHRGRFTLGADPGLVVGLALDEPTARTLALRDEESRPDGAPSSASIFLRFLDLASDAIAAGLEGDRPSVRAGELPERGFVFDLVSVSGRGLLVMQPGD